MILGWGLASRCLKMDNAVAQDLDDEIGAAIGERRSFDIGQRPGRNEQNGSEEDREAQSCVNGA